jgi:hypothetical protein
MKRKLLLPILLLVLAGCATTPAERIEKNRTAYASWPPNVEAMIRAGEIAVGFSPEQVRMALGAPDRVHNHTTSAGTAEIWSYRNHRPRITVGVGVMGGGGSTRVGGSTVMSSGGPYSDEVLRAVFENGVVSAIEQTAR